MESPKDAFYEVYLYTSSFVRFPSYFGLLIYLKTVLDKEQET